MVDVARARRLAVRIREIVASTLEREIKDPRLGMVTITDARVTPDLREASVFYTVYGDEAAHADSAAALESAKGVIRSTVGREVGLRHTPSLTFIPDSLPQAAAHIDDLIRKAHEADEQVHRVAEHATPAGEANPYRDVEAEADEDAEAEVEADSHGRGCFVTAAGAPAVDIDALVWKQALTALESVDEVALACHVSPDGDALGSMLALGLALRALGKRVRCSFSGAPEVPTAYALLPGQDLIVAEADFPRTPALLVTLDTASSDRLASLAPAATGAAEVLVIDHHERGDGYGTIRLVDPQSAATAVVVEELVRRLGVELTAEIATCVYTGLTTDTGSFKYVSTTPAVHELAGRLLATGMPHDRIARAIWDTHPFGYVRLLGAALGRAQLEADAVGGLGLVWTWTTAADLRDNGLGLDDVESVIDVVRTTAEAEVAVVLKEGPDGVIRVSTRAKGAVDVGEVCAHLGGGGHRFAAGFSSTDDRTATIARLRPRWGPRPPVRSDRADGLLVVDKPAGLTSHDVVARVRRLAGTRRVGHAGTLDPMATGVLVVGVGRATRLLGYLSLHDKDYVATVRLGRTTTTDDAEGERVGGGRPQRDHRADRARRPGRPHRRGRPGPARLQRDQGRRAPVLCARPCGGGRGAGAAAGDHQPSGAPGLPPGQRRRRPGGRRGRDRHLLVGHLHPGDRPGPRRGAGRRRSPDRPAAYPRRGLRRRLRAHPGRARAVLRAGAAGSGRRSGLPPPRRRGR